MSVQPVSPARILDLREQPVYCLLLASREQYSPCHIRVADSSERLSAILHGTQYYSLFRPIPEADKTLEMVVKLGHRHHQTAITQSARGYLIWVHEQDAVLAAPEGRKRPVPLHVFGSLLPDFDKNYAAAALLSPGSRFAGADCRDCGQCSAAAALQPAAAGNQSG